MDTLIEFSRVSFSYAADSPNVLEDISFSVRQGDFVAVVGHNGSGKSTLAKLCNGLYVPVSGEVRVNGVSTAGEENLLAIRQQVGLVFQNPDNQLVATVVEEDVAFAPENLGVPPEEIRARVDAALEAVGMTEYKLHAPHRLSGGQKQRVTIAGILAMQPACIVLDEPTAMLDPEGRREILHTICKLNKERGITILLITHHMDEAALAGRVMVMNKGSIYLDGSPGAVFARYAELGAIDLAVPQTVELTHFAGLPPAFNDESCAEALYSWIKGVKPC
ncbi:MAG: energy-coupling factor transporter ATPase [Oscillospiraceae bacterium]|jgi:energy-coupling factor transport system ATP-binding protein|nr:energy-coupling factor transporter ATPase [Oscillospiraceae bacterium]